MTTRSLSRLIGAVLLMTAGGVHARSTTEAVSPDPVSSRLGEDVVLIPGRFLPGAQPDGNTILVTAPAGLIAIDTGRHADHTQLILDLATREGVPIVAVINTHWHLDHIGGNPPVRTAFPDVRVWASDAFAEAQAGFLTRYRAQLVEAVAGSEDPSAKAAWQGEIAIIDAGAALGPDRIVTATGARTIAGRSLEIGYESHAVTAADLWVLDRLSGALAAGDLVTLPVPLLDTACPSGWLTALDHLSAVEFELLIPGHGAPMTREQFATYRAAFAALLTCASSEQSDEACIEGWIHDLGPLIQESERGFARRLLEYYIPSSLRAPAVTLDRFCGGDAHT